jgi:hypothetical protein
MLAEIFMVRLEAAQPPSQEKLPSSTSQFVPFNQGGEFRFREGKDRRVGSEPRAQRQAPEV